MRATRLVAGGTHYYSPHVAGILRRGYPCTPHQRLVLQLLAQGKTYAEIANELGTTEGAVGGHLDRIALKVGSRKITDMVLYFWKNLRDARDEPSA